MEGGIFLVEVHVVQKGDTLWKISRQYGISFEELKRVNAHLANPDYIVPGMKIFLPDKAKGMGEVKQPSTGAGQVKKTEKAPITKTAPPKVESKVSKQPKPLPKVPKPPKVPTKPSVEPITKQPTPKPKPETKTSTNTAKANRADFTTCTIATFTTLCHSAQACPSQCQCQCQCNATQCTNFIDRNTLWMDADF